MFGWVGVFFFLLSSFYWFCSANRSSLALKYTGFQRNGNAKVSEEIRKKLFEIKSSEERSTNTQPKQQNVCTRHSDLDSFGIYAILRWPSNERTNEREKKRLQNCKRDDMGNGNVQMWYVSAGRFQVAYFVTKQRRRRSGKEKFEKRVRKMVTKKGIVSLILGILSPPNVAIHPECTLNVWMRWDVFIESHEWHALMNWKKKMKHASQSRNTIEPSGMDYVLLLLRLPSHRFYLVGSFLKREFVHFSCIHIYSRCAQCAYGKMNGNDALLRLLKFRIHQIIINIYLFIYFAQSSACGQHCEVTANREKKHHQQLR